MVLDIQYVHIYTSIYINCRIHSNHYKIIFMYTCTSNGIPWPFRNMHVILYIGLRMHACSLKCHQLLPRSAPLPLDQLELGGQEHRELAMTHWTAAVVYTDMDVDKSVQRKRFVFYSSSQLAFS